jgi:uroporphyrinogen decarboxylase
MWFHPETAQRLGRLLEIPPPAVSEALGDDVRQIWANNNYAMEGIVHALAGERHVDAWGIGWVKEGAFNQIDHYPLANASEEEALAYRFPDAHLEELLAPMAEVARHAGDYFLGCDISPCVFEIYWRLRGMENTMMDMAAEPEFAAALLQHCADFTIRLGEEACRRFPLDWLWTGDDIAGQQGMLMSPALWRELVKPHLRRVVAVGKSHGLPVAYHSCGAVRPVIADLIDIGIDVLNPVQCNCPGMDPLELKQEFGTALTFMGGVDTQELLPHGAADDVRRATARLLEGMTSDGGGYILAASHTVPPETPDDNIFAMYEVAGVSRAEIFDRAAMIRAANALR